MADSVRKQVLDALFSKLNGIASVKGRVFRTLKAFPDVPGYPALCMWGAEDDKVIENTAHKGGLLRVYITGYAAGDTLGVKIEALAKAVEDAIEADPSIGLAAVDSRGGLSGARVVNLLTNSLALDGEASTEDYLNIEVLIPYRHLVAEA